MRKVIIDQPTLDERLGRLALLKEVYERLTDGDNRHGVIGIHGDWGSGKTSFLIQMEYLLTNGSQRHGIPQGVRRARPQLDDLIKSKPNYPVVWFEAWRFQNDPQPIVTLLQEIRKQLSPASQKFLSKAQKLKSVALESHYWG